MSFSPLSLAFSVAPRLPLRFVMRMADAGALIAARRGGAMIERLASNMARLTGVDPSDAQVRDAVRSHIRNYAEQLLLGSRRGEPLLEGVSFEGFEALAQASEDGPVVLALGHSGSWDRAGAWVCAHGRGIVTVAEKVEPPSLFERFVSLREGLGMEIIGVAKGESVFSTLVERVRGRGVIVPLLADRDISGSGIEVDFGTRRGRPRSRQSLSAHCSRRALPTRTRARRGPMCACAASGRSLSVKRSARDPTASKLSHRRGWTSLPP